MEFQEFEGKSTEEAIENACAHFQVSAEQLEIEIVSVGSPGLFGLGGRKAKIKAALREESEELLLTGAKEILETLLERMQEKATVSVHEEDDRISLRIETDDAGLLIGKQALRDAILGVHGMTGLSGPLTCSELGDCAQPNIEIFQVQKNEFQAIYP